MSIWGRAMRIRTSARLFAVSAILLFAPLNESATAQYTIAQPGPNNTLLELNPFLHAAATPAPAMPEPEAAPTSHRPRSTPERRPASRLAAATTSVRAQKAVKREPPANRAAGRRPTGTQKVQIAGPLTPPAPTAAVACATNAVASAPAPVEAAAQVVAPSRQSPETPEPVVAVVTTVTAGPSTQAGAGNPVEVKPLSTPPGATSTAERAPGPVEAAAPARQIPETPEPVVAVVGAVGAEPPAR
jgi:hypothetical protein